MGEQARRVRPTHQATDVPDARAAHMTTRSIANGLAAIAARLAAIAAGAGLLIPGLYRDAPYWVQQVRF
jgi:hypothetical protein